MRDYGHMFASTQFYDNIADICGIKYAGVFAPLDGSKPAQVDRTALVGPDALDCEHCVWLWPGGHCWAMSVRLLLEADHADLAKNWLRGGRGNSYEVDATCRGYLCLGYIKQIPLRCFMANRGTLKDARWKSLPRTTPSTHFSPCYWVTNYASADKSKAPVLLQRSLACLDFDLHFDHVSGACVRMRWNERPTRLQLLC